MTIQIFESLERFFSTPEKWNQQHQNYQKHSDNPIGALFLTLESLRCHQMTSFSLNSPVDIVEEKASCYVPPTFPCTWISSPSSEAHMGIDPLTMETTFENFEIQKIIKNKIISKKSAKKVIAWFHIYSSVMGEMAISSFFFF